MQDWVMSVRNGDFSAIPEGLDLQGSIELGHLIDGYRLTGGVTECAAVHRRVFEHRKKTGRFSASALDLWIALFFAHRSFRYSGEEPDKSEMVVLDRLAKALRRALLRPGPEYKARILAAMRDTPLLRKGALD
jgi:hypothetical protein